MEKMVKTWVFRRALKKGNGRGRHTRDSKRQDNGPKMRAKERAGGGQGGTGGCDVKNGYGQ